MTRRLSLIVAWASAATLIAIPFGLIYLLIDIDAFAGLGQRTLALGIRWETVEAWQWYVVWLLAVLYSALGLAGLYFLRRAFLNFADGQLFNAVNSQDLRRFALLLLVQAVTAPVHFALTSVSARRGLTSIAIPLCVVT